MTRPAHRRPTLLLLACLLAASVALAGCNSSESDVPNAVADMKQPIAPTTPNEPDAPAPDDNSPPDDTTVPPRVPVEESRAGTVYEQQIPVEATSDTLVVTVMEPAQLETGETYPLVLHGHGYGGSRSTTPDDFQQRLRDAGHYVISIDQRGFGESSGGVRVMSPDFEGQSLVALLDWTENLPGLRRRPNGKMVVGAYGGSYGGMYQYILAGVDPKQRLTVIAPDVAPYDLSYSLAPHGVPKTGWVLLLMAGGETEPLLGFFEQPSLPALLDLLVEKLRYPTNEDLTVVESLLRGAVTNRLPEATLNMLRYHSLRYFCEGMVAKPQNGFILGKPDPRKVASSDLPRIDALVTQGFRDTLFNFNDGFRAYQCLQQLGGDVRFLTHQSGHIVPLSAAQVPGLSKLADALAPILRVPEFQEAAGKHMCGAINLQNVTFAWFEEKLQGKPHALDDALGIGQQICLSLADGDAITVDRIKVGGRAFDIDTNTPALSGPIGVVTSLLGTRMREALLQTQPLYTAPDTGAILAGIPQIEVDITSLLDMLPEPTECTGLLSELHVTDIIDRLPNLPLVTNLLQGVVDIVDRPLLPIACDPVYFLALAERSSGEKAWDVIDGQITPIRGYGHHEINMNGIAERLSPGDEVALIILGFHLQYPLSFSRDLVTIGARMNGQVELPILQPTDIVREGV